MVNACWAEYPGAPLNERGVCYCIGYGREKARAEKAEAKNRDADAFIKDLAFTRDRAEAQVENLRRELDDQRRNNHARNVALDALHFVWCSGGCESGVHRYDHAELTQEIVAAAIRNTTRLVGWWISKGFKAEWKVASADARDAWMRAATENTELRAEVAELRANIAKMNAEVAALEWCRPEERP